MRAICAELCAEALAGSFGTGVLNAASPDRISAGDYFAALACSPRTAAARRRQVGPAPLDRRASTAGPVPRAALRGHAPG